MSYTTNRTEMYRQAAYYVDRILRGANAAELPVQAPTKYETAINLKTAKANQTRRGSRRAPDKLTENVASLR
jgi:ABC-type uncharacterized transport system substrate-binding protein